MKEKAVEKGLEIIFEEIDLQSHRRRSRSDSGAAEAGAGRYVEAFAKMIRWLARQGEKLLDPEISSEVQRYNRLGEEGLALVPDYEHKYALFDQRSNQWQELVGQARDAGCEAHPSENP